MIVLTRRGVLLGATTLSVAGLIRPLAAQGTERTNHAVLVACTDYPHLPPRVALKGPNNDAMMVREFLTQNAPVKFAPGNVTLLADNIEGAAASPTHKNILETLDKTAAKAKRGDFIYVHLSGHGSNQPAINPGDETDGKDEIFLPADTKPWAEATAVPNALLDNEIGAALDKIRATGAFVWFVIDACHSGTATRAAEIADGLIVERQVKPEDLGIPAERMAKAEAAAATRGVGDSPAPARSSFGASSPTGAAPAGKGGLVGFYAAQTVETTPEMPLPKGVENATRYGLFTYTLFSKVAENPNMTYRQLGQAILQQYAADARNKPTPSFDGDLDARVFGTEKTANILQWPLTVKDGAASVPAGLLHRLSKGSKLAVLDSPAADSSAALGFVEVTSARNLASRVKPVANGGKPAIAFDAIPPNAYARLTDIALNFALTVARPGEAGGLAEELKLVNAMLDEVTTRKGKRFNVTLVESGQEADIRLSVMRENAIKGAAADATDKPALWFLSASGDVAADGQERPPRIVIDPADPQKLADSTASNLEKIFRAISLSRLAAASDYRPEQVSVSFGIRREDSDKEETLDPSYVPTVNPGDIVTVSAKNTSTTMVDINVLYVGSDYSITHMGANRLEPSIGALNDDLLVFTADSFGMERMIAVLTEAPPISEIADLSFLEQGGVPSVMRSAGEGPGDFMGMLSDIGNAPATRSAMKVGEKGGQKGAVMIFSLQNVPRTS